VLGLSEEEQKTIYEAGLLHDIGKILTPEAVLLKPRTLNRKEYDIIKNHSADGEKMLLLISSFKAYAPIIRHHHEHFNGEGYPDKLKGDAIPLLSRIMSLADAFDAMTNNRIYKSRKNTLQAIEEIQRCAGTQFDPTLMDAAIEVFSTIGEQEIYTQAPHTIIDEARFSYFFKDTLTSAYSGDYLNYFLEQHKESKHFHCCYLVQLHHMKEYNQHMGWKSGNHVLIEIALRLKVLFQSNLIFRIFGDDFVVLNSSHVSIDEKEFMYKMSCGFDGIEVSLKHYDLNQTWINTWESFEYCLDR
jgi:GGDEF domain-containing protein